MKHLFQSRKNSNSWPPLPADWHWSKAWGNSKDFLREKIRQLKVDIAAAVYDSEEFREMNRCLIFWMSRYNDPMAKDTDWSKIPDDVFLSKIDKDRKELIERIAFWNKMRVPPEK